MRAVIADTETTGGSWRNGDRVLEIGMVEVENFIPTGRIFHQFIDPDYPVHWGALKVHGLTNDVLKKYPSFSEIASDARDFIGDDLFIAHNAVFDRGFLDMEFRRSGLPEIVQSEDSIKIFKGVIPGPYKLDNVVATLGLDLPNRDVHGALLDAAILAAALAEAKNIASIDISPLLEKAKPLPGPLHPSCRTGFSKPKTPVQKARPVAPSGLSKPGVQHSDRPAEVSPEKHQAPPIRTPVPVTDHRPAAKHIPPNQFNEMQHLLYTIRNSLSEAKDIVDFLDRIEASGFSVRPNTHSDDRRLHGLRFRGQSFFCTSSATGLKSGHFSEGRLSFNSEKHFSALEDRKKAYERRYGTVDQEKLPRLKTEKHHKPLVKQITALSEANIAQTAAPVRAPRQRRSIQVLPTAEQINIEHSDELRQEIEIVNSTNPSLDTAQYKNLRIGRDGWSGFSGAVLLGLVFSEIEGENTPLEAFHAICELPEKNRDAALRWVGRGLISEHALCKAVSSALEYERYIPETALKIARELTDPKEDADFDFGM